MTSLTDLPEYVLVTAARNEEAYIHATLDSVVAQTARPRRWAVVSDGSTDATDAIIREYAATNEWIRFVRMPEHRDRSFAAKVACFNAGWDVVRGIPHEVIGSLDADVSFEEDYFEYLLGKLAANSRLGVTGTPFVEEGFHSQRDTHVSPEHVSGACQLFRRKCFEQVGGYRPARAGGIDWAAVTTARMLGWETRSFDGRVVRHHRRIGTGSANGLRVLFNTGRRDYHQGGHPLWEILRVGFHMTKRPYIAGAVLLLAGYFWPWLRREPLSFSNELMRFHRGEQMARLKALLARGLHRPSGAQSITGREDEDPGT